MVEYTDPDLSEAEREALHDLQLGIEKIHRGYGALLDWHHHVGGGMDYFADAEERLREAGHTEFADELRDVHLPAGAVEDRWTYELVDEFRREFLADVTAFEEGVREALAEGTPHVTERRQQRRWRENAESEAWRADRNEE
ncbi:hypothetical protein [Halomarina oriensis]|uniref:Uncharacterized protein n=1 Tax=Halomarina oriensis TaxID=671145 RepID=A0A6B0GJ54_9EURY|nr:hypothetical protein [Halomarina oriensis]MWG34936.1 hypothetical protein [Halomarina oriensis]